MVKFSKKDFNFGQNFRKISILFKFFRKKKFDFGQNFRKNFDFGQIFQNSDFGRIFKKI